MADIAPFKGIRYDPTAVEDLATVVSPPYDVIAPAGRDRLEDASPYNVVRLVLGRDEPGDDERRNKYVRARALLDAWRASGVLQRDPDDALYVYEQRYRVGDVTGVQRGILAAVALEDPGAGGVLPHERTYDDIVDDRLRLLRATAANLDCVFCVYAGLGEAGEVLDAAVAADPVCRFRTDDDGVEHALWRVVDPAAIERVVRSLEKVQVVIADGHHRHRTAELYRAERRAAEGPGAWDRQLMFLVDVSRHGPALLPIHRVLSGIDAGEVRARLEPVFAFERADTTDAMRLAAEVARRRDAGRVYALLARDAAWWMRVADEEAVRAALPADHSTGWRDLDVSVLHAVAFERLLGGVTPQFVHHAEEVGEELEHRTADVAFLLAPPPFESVLAVAEAGDAMPQKSTFFVPKPKTGIVLRPLNGS